MNLNRKCLFAAVTATALVSLSSWALATGSATQGAFEGVNTLLQSGQSLDTLTQGAKTLAGEITALQAANAGTAKQKTKLVQLARLVALLQENITAATPDSNPDEISFLTGELASLKAQLTRLGLPPVQIASDIYAAPTGSGFACTQAEPCTLSSAQALARTGVAAGVAVTVTLLDGRYDLASTWQLTAADSGTAVAPVVWRAANPGQVTISGGARVTGWTQHDAARNIWVADVAAGSKSRQVYVNGDWAPIARASQSELGFSANWSATSTGYQVTHQAAKTWLANINSADPDRVEFVYHGRTGPWTQSRCPVQSVTTPASVTIVTMLPTCWDGMTKRPDRAPLESGGLPNLSNPSVPPDFVENHYSLLSEGEWFLDSDGGKLYYAPKADVDINTLDITLPKLERLLTVAGTLANPVHDIRFEGLRFSYATWLSPSVTGFAEVQSNLHITGQPNQGKCNVTNPAGTCPYGAIAQPLGNVDITASRSITFRNNVFRGLGGAGLSIRYGAKDTVIEGNHITQTSSTGLFLGCTFDPQPWDATTHQGIKQNCAPNPAAVADDQIGDNEIVKGTRVTNNVVHAVGKDYKAAPGITVLFGQDLRLEHNEVFDTPYTAITAGIIQGHATDSDNVENNPNINARNSISNNLIYNYMQELLDGGAVYIEGHQAQYVRNTAGNLDVDKTMANGMRVSNNVTLNDGHTNFSFYDDAGSQFIRWDGNVAFAINAEHGSQGGCSAAGYLTTVNNLFSRPVGAYHCQAPKAGTITASGNRTITNTPTLVDVPADKLAGAGLEPQYATLSASAPPLQGRYISPVVGGKALFAVTGLQDATKFYAGATVLTDVRRIGTSFAEVTVPDALAGQVLAVGQPAETQRFNETHTSVTNTGWSRSTGRSFGDFQADILYAQTNGSTVSFTFTGIRARVYGEKYSDQGNVEITVDGGAPVTVDTLSNTRQANVVIYETPTLPSGQHTVTLTKRSGEYATFDGYEVKLDVPPTNN